MQKAEKSKEMIPVYGYTEEGQLIAFLISYIEKEKKKSDLDKMLDIIQRLLCKYDSYIADFVVRLYANAREKGFSESIIETLSKILHDNTNDYNRCRNVIDVINRCLFFHLETEPHRHVFFDLLVKTINDFEPEIRKIILYHFKAENETILSLCQPPKDWEQLWVKNADDYYNLVLYGICTKCRIGYPFIIDYFKYQKERVANGYLCKTEGSFYVSPYILKYPPPFENS